MTSSPIGSTENAFRKMRRAAIVTLVLGVIALFLPVMAGIGVTLFLGALTVAAGLAVLFSFSMATGIGSAIWRMLVGSVYIFGGLYFFFHPGVGLTSLTLVLAVLFCFEGFGEVFSYLSLRSKAGSSMLLLNGLVTLLLSYVIWTGWPASALWAIGTILGINLISSGLSRLSFARAGLRISKRSY